MPKSIDQQQGASVNEGNTRAPLKGLVGQDVIVTGPMDRIEQRIRGLWRGPIEDHQFVADSDSVCKTEREAAENSLVQQSAAAATGEEVALVEEGCVWNMPEDFLACLNEDALDRSSEVGYKCATMECSLLGLDEDAVARSSEEAKKIRNLQRKMIALTRASDAALVRANAVTAAHRATLAPRHDICRGLTPKMEGDCMAGTRSRFSAIPEGECCALDNGRFNHVGTESEPCPSANYMANTLSEATDATAVPAVANLPTSATYGPSGSAYVGFASGVEWPQLPAESELGNCGTSLWPPRHAEATSEIRKPEPSIDELFAQAKDFITASETALARARKVTLARRNPGDDDGRPPDSVPNDVALPMRRSVVG